VQVWAQADAPRRSPILWAPARSVNLQPAPNGSLWQSLTERSEAIRDVCRVLQQRGRETAEDLRQVGGMLLPQQIQQVGGGANPQQSLDRVEGYRVFCASMLEV
jgi:hypothetical protein